jgi:hypothetical protein
MTHTTKKSIAVIGIAGLTLVGCGSTEAEEAETAPVENETVEQPEVAEETEADAEHNPMDGFGPMAAGTYELYPELGGYATFDLPTDPTHADIAPIEEYRTANNLDPLTYILIDVDNRDGTEMLKFPAITVYDEEGTAYEFQHLEWAIEDWQPERSWDMDNEEFWAPDGTTISMSEYQELEAQYDEITENLTSSVSAAERNTIILAYLGDDLPDEYTRVATITYGLGYEQDAYPTE